MAVPQVYLISSVADFSERWPELSERVRHSIPELLQSAQGNFTDSVTEPLWFELPLGARELLALAVLVAGFLEIADHDLPSVVVVLRSVWLS